MWFDSFKPQTPVPHGHPFWPDCVFWSLCAAFVSCLITAANQTPDTAGCPGIFVCKVVDKRTEGGQDLLAVIAVESRLCLWLPSGATAKIIGGCQNGASLKRETLDDTGSQRIQVVELGLFKTLLQSIHPMLPLVSDFFFSDGY